MKFRVWLGAKLYGESRSPKVYYIGPRKILRVCCHRTELEAMEHMERATIRIRDMTIDWAADDLDHSVSQSFINLCDATWIWRARRPATKLWLECMAGRTVNYSTKFTHADLSPSNIMVKDGKITAIIDWEFAGWFPEYWEYTKIYYGFREFRKDFYSEVKHFFTTYPEELDAEQAIWVITGPFDYDPVWTVVTAEQQRLEIEVKARAKPEIGNSEA
ncbi:hypothetical protein H103_02867 [Trichophyton rubrum CBS 288.86]|nr:hypothetical protein H103_02867 [Trichophyton rubrum CBS 288.86]EZF64978.1 hypothetical protein H104_02846 [Trichophyton rubrum CBS 289.86]